MGAAGEDEDMEREYCRKDDRKSVEATRRILESEGGGCLAQSQHHNMVVGLERFCAKIGSLEIIKVQVFVSGSNLCAEVVSH